MRTGRVANVIAVLGVAIDRPKAHQQASLRLEFISHRGEVFTRH